MNGDTKMFDGTRPQNRKLAGPGEGDDSQPPTEGQDYDPTEAALRAARKNIHNLSLTVQGNSGKLNEHDSELEAQKVRFAEAEARIQSAYAVLNDLTARLEATEAYQGGATTDFAAVKDVLGKTKDGLVAIAKQAREDFSNAGSKLANLETRVKSAEDSVLLQESFIKQFLGVETSQSLSYERNSVQHKLWPPSAEFDADTTYKSLKVTAKATVAPAHTGSAMLIYDVINSVTGRPIGETIEVPANRVSYDSGTGMVTAFSKNVNFREYARDKGILGSFYVDLAEIEVYDMPDATLARRAEIMHEGQKKKLEAAKKGGK